MNEKQRRRSVEIDILRFLSACMVATYHWTLEMNSESAQQILDIPILGAVISQGGIGVDIFFIISGYVIFNTAQRNSGIDFLAARFIRLFPGLLISMIMVLFVGSRFIHVYDEPIHSLINSVFLTYTITGTEPLATQLWTLIVEVKFYFGVVFLLIIFRKIFMTKIGILAILAMWQISLSLLENFTSPFARKLLLNLSLNGYAELFSLGAVLYLFRIRTFRFDLPTLGASILFLNLGYQVVFDSSYSPGNILLLSISVLTIVLGSKLTRFNSKFIEILGFSSYIIYLIHLHIGGAIINITRESISNEVFVYFTITMVAVTTISVITSLYLEKPLQKFLITQYKHFSK